MSDEVNHPERRADDFPEGTPWYVRMFVEDWRKAWTWLSNWFFVLIGSVAVLQEYAKDLGLTPVQYHYLTLVLAGLGILSRLVNQKKDAPAIFPPKGDSNAPNV